MMRFLIILGVPLFVWAGNTSLPQLLRGAEHNNEQMKSSEFIIKAKSKEVDAQSSAFYPTLDIGLSYTNLNPYSLVMPGKTTTGFVQFGWEVYDGGRKSALLRAKEFEHQSSQFEKDALQKSLTLRIISNFYKIKSLESGLRSLHAESKELGAQIERIKGFIVAGLATQEDQDRLQAAFDDNTYLVESAKLAILTTKEELWLDSGIEVRELGHNSIKEPYGVQFESYEATKILEQNTQALDQRAQSVAANYLPQLNLHNKYRHSNYDNVEAGGESFLLDNQNELTLSATMRIFDNGAIQKSAEALKYQKMALDEQKLHSQREQRMQFKVANSRLETLKTKFKSTKSALKASQSTYRAILKKYEVGLVDNITFLDALKKQTASQARYESTQYDYEIAKSIYYFYAGKDPKEFIQ